MFNDPSVLKKDTDIDLSDVKSENIKFFQINYQPAVSSHLTPKMYADNAVDEIFLVKNIRDNNFNNFNKTIINSFTLNTQAVNDNQVITTSYVDQFHQENERSGRDLEIDFYDESNDLLKSNRVKNSNVKKVHFWDSITVNRDPSSESELSNKNFIDVELDKTTNLRFN